MSGIELELGETDRLELVQKWRQKVHALEQKLRQQSVQTQKARNCCEGTHAHIHKLAGNIQRDLAWSRVGSKNA